MRIGILTQPLHTNYGGILQAFALQKVLQDLGHEVTTINFCKMEYYKGNTPIYIKVLTAIKTIIRSIIGQKRSIKNSIEIDKTLSKNIAPFIKKYIKLTPLVTSPKELAILYHSSSVDAFVVGSDQVWRPQYSPKIEHFFLDFCHQGTEKKVTYAASFGVDHWEFSSFQTKTCSRLAANFDKVSVREASAVGLCKKYLGVEAEIVLDPTLLLDKSVYENIVKEVHEPRKNGNLFVYLLDKHEKIQDLVLSISEAMNLNPFTTMPQKHLHEITDMEMIHECIYPSVEAWLRSFMDAEFVLTDSFHGLVFSLIFNKPFVAIGNEQRGQARFKSILGLFGLEDRLCTDKKEIINKCKNPIDWQSVNLRRNVLRTESIKFLKEI